MQDPIFITEISPALKDFAMLQGVLLEADISIASRRPSPATEASEVSSPCTPNSEACRSSHDMKDSSIESSFSAPDAKAQGITTLMIRNLPNSVRQKDVINKLDADGFGDQYDFLYMPCSFGKSLNKGYSFINMLTPEAAASLMEAWHKTCIFGSSSQLLDISAGVVQGFDANIAHWSSLKKGQNIRNARYRPLIRKASSDGTTPGALVTLQTKERADPAAQDQAKASP